MKDPNFRKKGRRRSPIRGRNEIGELLATRRTEQGWTLTEASAESGISHRIISKLEKGQLDTSISYLEKYLNFYGLTLSAKEIELNKTAREKESLGLDDKGLPKW